MLKIEEGKFYRTRDGRKVGRMVKSEFYDTFYDPNKLVTSQSWSADGSYIGGQKGKLDLVLEWHDSPIITVTSRELRDGEYGRFSIMKHEGRTVLIGFNSMGDLHFQTMSVDELREAAHLFNQIAEFLEEGK